MRPSTSTRNELITYVRENDLVARPEHMSWRNLYRIVMAHQAALVDFDSTLHSFAIDARMGLESSRTPEQIFDLWNALIEQARREFPSTNAIVERLNANADAYNNLKAVPLEERGPSYLVTLQRVALNRLNSLVAAADVF